MTIKRKLYLWIPPSFCGRIITLTGGTFQDYGISYNVYKDFLYTYDIVFGRLYPFDPESRTKAVAHVEDRGRFTKSNVWNNTPMFSNERYTNTSYFLMTQYIYTFDSKDCAKKAFECVKNAYETQLKAYESMKEDYDSKKRIVSTIE
jgi:hypothetical protein